MVGVPLADDEVAVVQGADVVDVFKNEAGTPEAGGGGLLEGGGEGCFGIKSAGSGEELVVFVENDEETGGGLELAVGVVGPADTGEEFVAVDDGAADVGAGEMDGFEVFS